MYRYSVLLSRKSRNKRSLYIIFSFFFNRKYRLDLKGFECKIFDFQTILEDVYNFLLSLTLSGISKGSNKTTFGWNFSGLRATVLSLERLLRAFTYKNK